jgi:hypothetical protein
VETSASVRGETISHAISTGRSAQRRDEDGNLTEVGSARKRQASHRWIETLECQGGQTFGLGRSKAHEGRPDETVGPSSVGENLGEAETQERIGRFGVFTGTRV